MDNVTQWLVDIKIARNTIQAGHIATGCKLWECATDDEKLARVNLYRNWRNSKVFGRETAPCFEKAIAGEDVPTLDDMQSCGHRISSIFADSDGTSYCMDCADEANKYAYENQTTAV